MIPSVLLCFFSHIFPILLALHKFLGKDGICPGLNWIVGCLEFIDEGLRVSLVSKGYLRVVDIAVCTVNHLGVIWVPFFHCFFLMPRGLLFSHPVLLDVCPFLEELQ